MSTNYPGLRVKDRELFQEWVNDLLTTTDPQTRGKLTRTAPGDGGDHEAAPTGDCCLGRFCKILVQYDVLETMPANGDDASLSYFPPDNPHDISTTAPPTVAWEKIFEFDLMEAETEGYDFCDLIQELEQFLINMNDEEERPFADIGVYLREEFRV